MAQIKCKGKTSAGAACRAPAGSGGLCFFHANPDSAKSLGQIGGRKNRRPVVDLQVPDHMTAADVCQVTGQAIRLLLAGDLRAREASALAQLCNSLYRIIPVADLEARITALEQNGSSKNADPTMSPANEPDPAESNARLESEQQSLNLIDETEHAENVARERER